MTPLPEPLEEHQPRRRRSAPPEPPLLASAIGYLVAWGLVFAVGMAACSAMLGPSHPVTAPSATEPAYVAPAAATRAPARTPTPKRTPAPARTAAPSFDLNLAPIDCDPNDPQMDPEYDPECAVAP